MPTRIPTLAPLGAFLARRVKQYDPEAKGFYNSSSWLATRREKLKTQPLCERCLASGIKRLAKHVHHKKTRAAHPHMALHINNLESLCASCHSRHHARDHINGTAPMHADAHMHTLTHTNELIDGPGTSRATPMGVGQS